MPLVAPAGELVEEVLPEDPLVVEPPLPPPPAAPALPPHLPSAGDVGAANIGEEFVAAGHAAPAAEAAPGGRRARRNWVPAPVGHGEVELDPVALPFPQFVGPRTGW